MKPNLKPIIKRFFKIFGYLVLAYIISVLLFVRFLISNLNPGFNRDEVDRLQTMIKASEPLPENFMAVYNEMYSVTSNSGKVCNLIMSGNQKKCPCADLAGLSRGTIVTMDNLFIANPHILAWKLEKEVSQGECLNLIATQYDFLYQNIGIRSAAKSYFNSKLLFIKNQVIL